MSNQDNEKRISNQFGGFCTRVLKNEARKIHNEYIKQRKQEVSFDELTPGQLIELSANDKYFCDEHIFNVLDKEIVVVGNILAEALKQLPDIKRDVILLSYFAGLSDTEIGKLLNTIQQTVSKRRISTLKLLRDYFAKEGIEWDDI